MKSTAKTLLSTLIALTVAGAAQADFRLNPDIARQLQPLVPIQPLFLCSDLTTSIATHVSGGEVIVTTTVRNIGLGDYVSGAHQQRVVLRVTETPIHTYAFGSLPQGASRSWVSRFPVDERANRYRTVIEFDPSVATDGNPRNNECNAGNNGASANLS